MSSFTHIRQSKNGSTHISTKKKIPVKITKKVNATGSFKLIQTVCVEPGIKQWNSGRRQ